MGKLQICILLIFCYQAYCQQRSEYHHYFYPENYLENKLEYCSQIDVFIVWPKSQHYFFRISQFVSDLCNLWVTHWFVQAIKYFFCWKHCYEHSFEFVVIQICVPSGFESQCAILARDTQDIRCVYVQDGIECANLLRNGSTGFGVFSAETTLLLAAVNYDGLTVVKELRHRDRLNCEYD